MTMPPIIFIRCRGDYLAEIRLIVNCACAGGNHLCGRCTLRDGACDIYYRTKNFWHP